MTALALSALGPWPASAVLAQTHTTRDPAAQAAAQPALTKGEIKALREFKLLEYLMRHKDRVVTRTMLLEQVWDYRFDPHTSVVDTHISRLRKKIDEGFAQPLLHTLRGTGYRLSQEP